jgi:hypothetical protein
MWATTACYRDRFTLIMYKEMTLLMFTVVETSRIFSGCISVDTQNSQCINGPLFHVVIRQAFSRFRMLKLYPDSAVETGAVTTISESVFSRFSVTKFQRAQTCWQICHFYKLKIISTLNLSFENVSEYITTARNGFTEKTFFIRHENLWPNQSEG